MSNPQRILVVDDEREIRDMTRMVLSAAGYEVATAASGKDALKMVREAPPDLVLLDINMPGMDGWETLRLLRAGEFLGDIPVVMFSVKSEFRDRVHGIQEGAVDYVTKPFEVDGLLARVRRVLDAVDRGGSHLSASSPPRVRP